MSIMSKNAELIKNIVQEIAKSGEVPQEFLHKDSISKAIEIPDLWKDTLLIDFSLIFSSSTATAENELEKLRSALSNWGYFQAINHGIEKSFLEEVLEVCKQFFSLPLEEKVKYTSADEKAQGYATKFQRPAALTNYWSDRLYLNLQPEDGRKQQFWPQKPENFSKTIDEYSKKLMTFSEEIYKAMARSLSIEDECFRKNQGTKRSIGGAFNLYPSCPYPDHDRVLGLKTHSDGSNITILLPDQQVCGLQVLKDDIWYNVPVIPGALLINMGDLGEVMTNGVFKRVIHRVVPNFGKERMSVVSFCNPDPREDIGPVFELINDQHPRRYKKLTYAEYQSVQFKSGGFKSERIDAFKV